ncbi:hypothetical protein SRABI128_05990 [Microbacterium sp. Bi128]|nr:hypothetical protein SRABI128_05990 [Microbacterium sp. Bi128]
MGTLFDEVAGVEGAGRADQEVAVGVSAAQIEQGGGLPAKVHQDRLVLHDGVGNHQLSVGTLTGRHFGFRGGHQPALLITVLLDFRGAVLVRPEFRDALTGEDGVAEEVVIVGVRVDHGER